MNKHLERALLGAFLLAVLSSVAASISLEQSFLAVAAILWIVLLVQKRRRLEVPAFFWPLLVYAGVSLLSSAFSVNPGMSFTDSGELALFLAVPVALAALRRRTDLELALGALLVSSFVNTVHALGYQVLKAGPDERVEGFMAHYMTQAGLLAVFAAFALGIVLFRSGWTRIAWAAGFFLAAAALFITYTRSSWIGLGVAFCAVLLFWKPKALALVPVLAGLAYLAAPQPVKTRAVEAFTGRNISNTARVQYAKAGFKIAVDYLPFGTGPDTVDMVFQNPKYGLGEFAKRNVHLHSNVVQIAAERGPFSLAAWLAFVVLAFSGLWKIARRNPRIPGDGTAEGRALAVGALAALSAFFVAGFFEYNFGDSEITLLLLVVLTLPFASRLLVKGGD